VSPRPNQPSSAQRAHSSGRRRRRRRSRARACRSKSRSSCARTVATISSCSGSGVGPCRSSSGSRQAEHTLADDVALDVGGAAADRVGERLQVRPVHTPSPSTGVSRRASAPMTSSASWYTRWCSSPWKRRTSSPRVPGTRCGRCARCRRSSWLAAPRPRRVPPRAGGRARRPRSRAPSVGAGAHAGLVDEPLDGGGQLDLVGHERGAALEAQGRHRGAPAVVDPADHVG
jgi:hypothetical protein